MNLEKIITAIAIFLSYFLQTSVDFFRLGEINPDFLLILTIFFSLTRGSYAGIWVGFFGGLLQDINLGGFADNADINYYIGVNALPKVLIGYFIGKISKELTQGTSLVLFAITLGANLFKGLLTFFLIAIFHTSVSAQTILTIILPETIYTAILAVFWFRLLRWVLPPSEVKRA